MRGRPLRDRVQGSLDCFLRSNEAIQRRVILVCSIANIPAELQLAAALVGARVQEDMRVDMMHFQQIEGLHISFTKRFAAMHKAVVAAARSGSQRTPFPGRPRCITVYRPKRCFHEVHKVGVKAAVNKFAIVYACPEDEEVATLRPQQARCARSWSEVSPQACCRRWRSVPRCPQMPDFHSMTDSHRVTVNGCRNRSRGYEWNGRGYVFLTFVRAKEKKN